MSQVATWVLGIDGRFYEEPTLYPPGYDPASGEPPDWYLCFDDDDPPELVIREGKPLPDLPYLQITGKGQRCTREFYHGPYRPKNPIFWLRPAKAYFGKLTRPIPAPDVWREGERCSEVGGRPEGECVYYAPAWPTDVPDPRPPEEPEYVDIPQRKHHRRRKNRH